jgi:hypothetical protein
VNIFDVIPFLGRRALNFVGIVLVLGLLVLPGTTRGFVAGQFNSLRVQITHELTLAIPPRLRTSRSRLAAAAGRPGN